VAVVDAQLRDRDEFLLEIRERLLLAQEAMSAKHDLKHRELVFAVGDWARLHLHHRTAVGITPARSTKLGPQVFWSLSGVGQDWVGGSHSRCFSCCSLEAICGDTSCWSTGFAASFGPWQVVRARLYRGIWELLVQWEGQTAADASWSPLEDFKKAFPVFQLELFSSLRTLAADIGHRWSSKVAPLAAGDSSSPPPYILRSCSQASSLLHSPLRSPRRPRRISEATENRDYPKHASASVFL
jgi:hypothetical protein